MIKNVDLKVLEIQKEFLKRLVHNKLPSFLLEANSSWNEKQNIFLLFDRIVECDSNLLEFTLGNVGHKLKSFVESVDFQHPEVNYVFETLINGNQTFAKECLELLTLGEIAREKKLNSIIPSLGKIITKDVVDVSNSNRMHVCLLKDSKDRDEIRTTKRMQKIDLSSALKNEEIWNNQPDSFEKFIRFDSAYEEDVEIAKKKIQRYENLGCSFLANEVRKNIEEFETNMQQSYYGFNRIKMTNAAIILAKSLGYSYLAPQESTVNSSWGGGKDLNYLIDGKITVDRSFFGKFNFDPQHIVEFCPGLSHLKGSPIFNYKKQIPFNYEPRVYPLHAFSDIITEQVKNTIAILESFPDANNKPIFDHFGVIVPGIDFPIENQKEYSFIDDNGIVQSYSLREDALKALDRTLIKGNYFYPLIIGERDGKCFFICYWS